MAKQHDYNLTRDEIIEHAVEIANEYANDDMTLTLRQMYYQFVARGLEGNGQHVYKRIGSILTDARFDGSFPIEHLEDRGRSTGEPDWREHEDDVDFALDQSAQAIRSFPYWYLRRSRWWGQPKIVSVWCFPDHTGIMVEEGVVPIATIEEGDRVLTREGGYKPVTEIMRREFTGDLVVLKTTGLPDMEATQEHPILVLPWDASKPGYSGRRRKYHPPKYKDFGDVSRNDMVLVPRLKAVIEDGATGLLKLQGGSRSTPITLQLDSETYAILGLYLAEGSLRGDGRTVQFCFGGFVVGRKVVACLWGTALPEKCKIRRYYRSIWHLTPHSPSDHIRDRRVSRSACRTERSSSRHSCSGAGNPSIRWVV